MAECGSEPNARLRSLASQGICRAAQTPSIASTSRGSLRSLSDDKAVASGLTIARGGLIVVHWRQAGALCIAADEGDRTRRLKANHHIFG